MSWVNEYLDDYQHLIDLGREEEVPEEWREVLTEEEPLPPPDEDF